MDDGPPEVLPPYAWGSHRSRLVDVLKQEHYDVQLSREDFDRIVTWIDLNAPYYGSYYTAYPDAPFGRSPLNHSELTRLAELTGVPVQAPNVGAELRGSQVNLTRPELSPCLEKLGHADPAYQEALAIIRQAAGVWPPRRAKTCSAPPRKRCVPWISTGSSASSPKPSPKRDPEPPNKRARRPTTAKIESREPDSGGGTRCRPCTG